MKSRTISTSLFVFFLTVVSFAADAPAPKPIQLSDILAWKRIQGAIVSNDGQWFAYRLAPAEGNAEFVVRNLKTGKETRYPLGDRVASSPAPNPALPPNPAAAAGALAPSGSFSDDSQWVAFTAYPLTRDAKRMKTQRRPIQTKAVLVELASGKKVEYEKTKRFAFSGEKSTVIALHRFGPEAAPAAGAAAPAPPAAGASTPDRPAGSDLVVRELATGSEMNLGNVSEFAFNKKGDSLAWLVDATDKAGNGLELRSLDSGSVRVLDSAQAVYKSLTWNDKGDALAALRGADDKGFEDKLYTLVAFKDLTAATPTKVVFDPREDKNFPVGMTISANRAPMWRDNLTSVTFGIHEVKTKKNAASEGDAEGAPARPAAPEEDKPSLVLWHYKDARLQTQQQVQENADKNFSYLAVYNVGDKKFVRLADETLRNVTLNPEQKFAVGTDIREYERSTGMVGRSFQDVYVVDPATGTRKLALKKAEHVMSASPDGTKFLHYEDGVFFVYDMVSGKSTEITKQIPATFYDTEDDHNVVKPPAQSFGWTKDNANVLLSDGWDIWKVSATGGKAVNLTVNGKKEQIRYRAPFNLDPDNPSRPGRGGAGAPEKGYDLSQTQYLQAYGEWTKKAGLGTIAPDQAGVHMLQWGDAAYAALLKAKKADVYLYTRENTQHYPDYYVTGKSLADGEKITDADPQQKNLLWPSSMKLVDYTSTRGEKLQAAMWLPANYDASKKYPMLVYIYEKLSNAANSFPQPTYNGFSIAQYTSNGYVVLEPDIVYKVNDPGMSAVACVVPAVKAAIATGAVDATRVGITGHSWGGYQTAFLVTQTDIFRAAIAGAPLTDMVSMYSLIYKNSGQTNQGIFESSQGRFKGGYWENMDAYIRNSPVYHAGNVKTPLMILHNDKDGAVDQTQGIEYYNTLRRMGKVVLMLEYKGENHGLAKPENMKDYTVRMRQYFDHYLMDKPAPAWMEEGIPLLKMKDHLDAVAMPASSEK